MSDLVDWRPLDWVPPDALEGQHARMERLDARHLSALHAVNPPGADHWHYMPYGPFPDEAAYVAWAEPAAKSADPVFYAVRGAAGWSGVASLMRVDRVHGVVEIGNIAFSPPLQRTAAATEAVHLMLDHCFAAGFRRVEWKCDADNAPSRRAAARYGFGYEGTFRQHMVIKGRNRDTAWFAMLDTDWPRLRMAHLAWLAPQNFGPDGVQKRALSALIVA